MFLPGSLLPLHVFEPRYRALVADVMDGSGLFAVPQLAPGWESRAGGSPAVHEVAGLGQIVRHQPLDEGRCNLILYGIGRVRIVSEAPVDTPYRQVRAQLLADRRPGDATLARLVSEVQALGAGLVTVQAELAGALARVAEGRKDPLAYLDTVAHLVLTTPDARQAWLDEDDVEVRTALVQAALASLLAGAASVEA